MTTTESWMTCFTIYRNDSTFTKDGLAASRNTCAEAMKDLVGEEKSATLSHLQDAWDKPGKKGNADPADTHPVTNEAARDAYLRGVRGHLSLQPWRWVFVAFRNWSEPSQTFSPTSTLP